MKFRILGMGPGDGTDHLPNIASWCWTRSKVAGPSRVMVRVFNSTRYDVIGSMLPLNLSIGALTSQPIVHV